MVSVNGNFENKGNYFLTKDVVKKEIAGDKVEKAVVENKADFKERGDELLAAGMYGKQVQFVSMNERLDNETAVELKEMFEMAGISFRLPTAAEYARIAGSTVSAVKAFQSFETERNIEMLFANSNFMDMLAEEANF